MDDRFRDTRDRLLRFPGLASVSLTDPRFAWIGRELIGRTYGMSTVGDVLGALKVHDFELLLKIQDYASDVSERSLSEELTDVALAILQDDTTAEGLISALGWDGGSGGALLRDIEEVGYALGLSKLQGRTPWLPVLTRALKGIPEVLPISDDVELQSIGVSRQAVENALEIFRGVSRTDTVEQGGKDLSADDGGGVTEVGEGETVDGYTATRLWTIKRLLIAVQKRTIMLPEIQRSYVWKPAQVRDLVDSLYHGYPIGSLLLWETDMDVHGRGVMSMGRQDVQTEERGTFLIDGQQRLTSLMRAFVSGETVVLFNAVTEQFRIVARPPRLSPRAIPITLLWGDGFDQLVRKLGMLLLGSERGEILGRLRRLESVLERKVPVDLLRGFDYAEVTEVFTRVNSRGTRLKTAELAIASIAHRMPGIIDERVVRLCSELRSQGWEFPISQLLRILAAVASGNVSVRSLDRLPDSAIQKAWDRLEKAIPLWLHHLRTDVGIPGSGVVPSAHTHILPIVWVTRHPGEPISAELVPWFVHANSWSRYSGQTDTNLDRDLRDLALAEMHGDFSILYQRMRTSRPSLQVTTDDIRFAGSSSPLALLMYLSRRRLRSTTAISGSSLSEVEQEMPRTTPIWESTTLRREGTSVMPSQLLNLVHVYPSEMAELDNTIVSALLGRSPEDLRAMSLPIMKTRWSQVKPADFFNQRLDILVEDLNAVLADVRSTDRAWGMSTPAPAVSPTQEGRIPDATWDPERRQIVEEVTRRLRAMNRGIRLESNAVYMGFYLPGDSRPFLTVSVRTRRVTTWHLTCAIEELDDPALLCEDKSAVSRHGYGPVQVSVRSATQIDPAFQLFEQALELNDNAKSSVQRWS